jgi:hypothetical protein
MIAQGHPIGQPASAKTDLVKIEHVHIIVMVMIITDIIIGGTAITAAATIAAAPSTSPLPACSFRHRQCKSGGIDRCNTL